METGSAGLASIFTALANAIASGSAIAVTPGTPPAPTPTV
jgi:hypothetical protein